MALNKLNRNYVDFEARFSPYPLDGSRRVCEIPDQIYIHDLKQIGRFLHEKFKNENFNITEYYTFRQKAYKIEHGEELKGERTDISETYCLYKGYPVSIFIMQKRHKKKEASEQRTREDLRSLEKI